ncbi:Uncharacterized protein C18B11.03c [Colletotrichum chlorophyti]|uniref:Uncharacterized protein C18B11.03c n=1 Tax=Colletotrichum chlorophyti TaxID=708187 RepID=A0A1Q8S5H3_9PEZI|nr:Uncharacterized protein C18B11.03c [Colletotrichum chlorophyti]
MATKTSVLATEDNHHGEPATGHYSIVRKSTNLDRMFYLYHRLGIQSNVLVAARYATTRPGDQHVLSNEAIFSALHAVVSAYPELGIVGAMEPGPENKNLLSLASLHTIDLDSCVEFIDDDKQKVDAEFLGRLHSQWLWAEGEIKPGQPWWKVIVLGRQDVVFLFHHLVCDGSFGMDFHREFLAALNASAANESQQQTPHSVQLNPGRVKLSEKLEATMHAKPPMFGVICNLFKFLFYRFFYAKKLLFTNFPKPGPPVKNLNVAQHAERTVTKVTTYRISAEKTNAIIAACRAHGTTFTPFFTVLVAGTLAADFYPEAEVGFTRYAVDMRAAGCIENPPAGQGRVINSAASLPQPEWLKKYHRAFPPPATPKEKHPAHANMAVVDAKAAWKLINHYGKRMKKARAGGHESQLYKAWISGNALGPSLEEMVEKSFPSMGLFMQNSFSVSNVGVLKPAAMPSGAGEPAFRIDDVQFSAGPIQGTVGYHGIVFNIVGVAGGGTVINACTEEGVAPEGMSRAVLDGVMARINALLQGDSSDEP